MSITTNRRAFLLRSILMAGVVFAPSVWSAEKRVSNKTPKGAGGKVLINSDKHKLIRIDSRNMKISDIMIKSGNKSASLKSIIGKLEIKPAAGKEILIADKPSDFPGISKKVARQVSELGENESLIIDGEDYSYGCSWVGYFCYSY